MLVLLASLMLGAAVEQSRDPLVMAPSMIVGTLPMEALKLLYAQSEPEFEACVSPETAPGKIGIKFRTDGSGQLLTLNVVSSTLNDPELESCLLRVVHAIQVPPLPGGGGVIVTWNLKINSTPSSLTLDTATVTKGQTDQARVTELLLEQDQVLASCMDGAPYSGTLTADLKIDALGHLVKVKNQREGVQGAFCLKRAYADVYFPRTKDGKSATVRVVYQFESGLD